MIKKDALGRELSVGDKVIYVNCSYKNEFRSIDTAVVEKICNCMIKLSNTGKEHFRWGDNLDKHTVYRLPNRIVKM